MQVRLILVPYHLGREGSGAATGPARLLAEGVDEALRSAGHEVAIVTVDRGEPFSHEVAASFAVNRRLADAVRVAAGEGAFPLVLAADCGSCLGTLAGLALPDLGVVWLDAHGDFNTPETTVTGYLDGMGLAVTVGRCWRPLAATLPGFRHLPEELVVLAGARDLDPAERALLKTSAVTVVAPGAGFLEHLSSAVESLRERVGGAFLLLDADVLDPSEGRANAFAAPGGISADELAAAVAATATRLPLRAASVTAYDPDFDQDGRVARTLVRAIGALAGSVAR